MNIFETAKKVFKRRGESMQHYFRCTVGAKKGKLTADPASCGKRPNPKRVRHGKIVAKTKGAIRVHKTIVAKRTNVSKRVAELNRRLNNLFKGRSGVQESLSDYMLKQCLLVNLVEWVIDTENADVLDDELFFETVIDNLQGLYEDQHDPDTIATEIYSQLGYTVIFD